MKKKAKDHIYYSKIREEYGDSLKVITHKPGNIFARQSQSKNGVIALTDSHTMPGTVILCNITLARHYKILLIQE